MSRRQSTPAGRSQHWLPQRRFATPDELTCYFDSKAEPSNIHLEVRIPGRLDREAFRCSAIAALAANPQASSRRAPCGPLATGYSWERPPEFDIDPVTFTTYASETDLAAQRMGFIARSPSIDLSPPASILLASGPGGDVIVLNAHHATMDGLSWLDLVRDIGKRYCAAAGRAAYSPAGEAPAIRSASPPPASLAASVAVARGRRARVPLRRPARIASERGGRRGYGLHQMLLPAVPAVRPLDGGVRPTLTEALVAALIAAIGQWNGQHARPSRPVRITAPFNARQPGNLQAAGNHSRLVTITAMPPCSDDDYQRLMLDVVCQTRYARARSGPQVGPGSRGLSALWFPTAMKRLAVQSALRIVGPFVCDTAMLTNLGNVVDPPDFGQPPPVIMAFSAQAQMPRGLTVGVITAGGRPQLTLRYNRALFDASAAEEFAAGMLMALGKVSRLDSQPLPPPCPGEPDQQGRCEHGGQRGLAGR